MEHVDERRRADAVEVAVFLEHAEQRGDAAEVFVYGLDGVRLDDLDDHAPAPLLAGHHQRGADHRADGSLVEHLVLEVVELVRSQTFRPEGLLHERP